MPAAGGAGARHGSVISAPLVPAPNPAHRMPTSTALPLPPRCAALCRGSSVPSGGVQLGVGELVSALAAPSPLIAGANTILAISHLPNLDGCVAGPCSFCGHPRLPGRVRLPHLAQVCQEERSQQPQTCPAWRPDLLSDGGKNFSLVIALHLQRY